MSSANPIIIVTGANSGVGLGICERLLIQLSSSNPSDSWPQERLKYLIKVFPEDDPASNPVHGLTLIMACRCVKKAEVARQSLYKKLDAHIIRQKQLAEYDGHAEHFRENLRIEIHRLDLAVIQSVFDFATDISSTYPYVSHLICNAGVINFKNIDWAICLTQLAREPVQAVTAPEYYRQYVGKKSVDGFGWVWQCNVFGHYCLFRALETHLAKSKSALDFRVIWTSSIEASPKFYDSTDWQLVTTEHSYESSKYQIDMIATHLDRRATEAGKTRHIVTQPGVAHTNINAALIYGFLEIFKILSFYMARMLNSPHHTIQGYKAAIAVVHLSLISLPAFGASIPQSGKKYKPVRFGSETDMWGTERVGVTPVKAWNDHMEDGEQLLENCENLYQELWEAEVRKESDS